MLDRLASLVDAAGETTQLGYDGLDHLLSVVDPRSLATSYEYNAFGDSLELTSPDTGVSAFTRDTAGHLDGATDARNESAEYSYDAVGRVTEIEYADQTIELNYDEGTNGAGRLTSLEDGSGDTVWTYDALGRVLQRTQTTGSVELEIGYAYDTFGRLATLTTPSGQEIAYSYTSGRVTGVTVNGLSLLEGITYEPFGPTTGWEWGNGATTVRDYDTDGQLVYVSSAGASTYTYFPDGLIQSRDDDFEVSIPTTAGTTSFTLASTSNRLTAASGLLTRTYSYDAAGNTLSDGAKSFTYDDSGRMNTSTAGGLTTTYSYNGLGERVKKTNSAATVNFAYDEAGHLLGEYGDEGELIQETVWFEDMPVATLRPDGEGGVDVYYVHVDHLNTPRRITDPADNEIIWRWDSEPFGATAADEDPDEDTTLFTYNLRFPGQYFDDETGLHYNYFRDYDPVTGRYTRSDPIGLEGGINTYAYAGGNPVRNIDPLGLSFDSLTAACMQQMDFCLETGLIMADNAVTLSGDECLDEAWVRARSRIERGIKVAAVVAVVAGAGAATKTIASRLAAKGLRSLDELSRAAGAVSGKNGLTVAGHALTKHAVGQRAGSSAFPALRGNPASINRQAQDIVDDILTAPGTTVLRNHRGRFGETVEYIAPDGRGIVYGSDGKFLFFREGGL